LTSSRQHHLQYTNTLAYYENFLNLRQKIFVSLAPGEESKNPGVDVIKPFTPVTYSVL
jgi:hypothetical protein